MSKIFLEANQIRKMYEIAGSGSIRDEVLLRIMGNTGLRVSDAKSLKVDDVVDRYGNIHTSIRKKTKKTGAYVERNINDATRQKIKDYLPQVQGRSVYLFPGISYDRPIGRTYCHELFKRVLIQLMPEGTDSSAASTHTLRRSIAMMIAEATSIQVASEFLGHKSIASTTAYLSKEILGREARDFMSENMDF